MAEREGFEPPIALRLCLISSQVHSTGLCHLSVGLQILESTHFQSTGEGVREAIPARQFAAGVWVAEPRVKRAATERAEVLLYLWSHLTCKGDAKALDDGSPMPSVFQWRQGAIKDCEFD